MKTINNYLVLLCLIISFSACKENKTTDETEIATEEATEVQDVNYYNDGVLEVITEAMEFQTADTINSGWNKIVYKNLSPEVHFILLDIYPEGITLDTIKARVMPAFAEGMALIMEGKNDSAMAAFGKLPSWFPEVRFVGGTGLISPNKTAETTVNLEPGNYIMECYVKMANGEFHVNHGMYKQLHVLNESTGLNSPSSELEINLSSDKGIEMKGDPISGKQLFKVNFIDQTIYENFVGHDVSLVKYENDADIDSLINWMNWMDPAGLITPAPEGFTFLGGVNNQEPGTTGFFEVELSPGNYVLIAEVPEANNKGLFKTFTVE